MISVGYDHGWPITEFTPRMTSKIQQDASKEFKDRLMPGYQKALAKHELKMLRINFPQEKILTVSAEDYCKSAGKNLSDYQLIGLKSGNLRLVLPENTEVIVGYGWMKDWNGKYQTGTALVPKN